MDQQPTDDQSHYEVSLTAGQAFVAFVLLLLSLAASFTFGLVIGKGQGDERLVVRETTPVVTEAGVIPRKPAGQIVELGVPSRDDFEAPVATTAGGDSPVVVEEEPKPDAAVAPDPQPAPVETVTKPAETKPVETKPVQTAVPHYAQILSTGDQKTAESLAVRLIDRGFSAAYVERGSSDKGPIFRVRVKFASEDEARSAEPRLREFSKDIWIARQSS